MRRNKRRPNIPQAKLAISKPQASAPVEIDLPDSPEEEQNIPTTVDSRCGRSRHRCGLCRRALCVPPTYYNVEEKFYICGICYNSEIYFPDDSYKHSDIIDIRPESLYDSYITNKNLNFTCSYKNCSEILPLGGPSENHMRICENRTFNCPASKMNRYYLPIRYQYTLSCEFESANPQEMYAHIKSKHPDLMIVGSISASDLKNRALFVLDDEEKISIIYLDKASDDGLRITCRQMKNEEIFDRCVIRVVNKKYVIDCCDYCIGPPNPQARIILKNIIGQDRIIYFSTVSPEKEALMDFGEEEEEEDFVVL